MANNNYNVVIQWDQNLHHHFCKHIDNDGDGHDGDDDDDDDEDEDDHDHEDRGEGVLEQLKLGQEGYLGS